MILTGDCLEVMPTLEAGSVDAVVCDPPYDLTGHRWDSLGDDGNHSANRQRGGFMGRKWDGTGVAFRPETWAAAFRVAKPGAYLLAFGGTRTYHRLTCAIEDAGWIIRDCLVWAYASGFPKSRALLKPAWEPIVMARKPGPLRELAIDACRIGVDGGTASVGEPNQLNAVYGDRMGGLDSVPLGAGRWPSNLLLTDPIFDGDTPGVVGGGISESGISVRRNGPGDGDTVSYGFGMPVGTPDAGYTDSGTYSRFFLLPKAARSEREPARAGCRKYRMNTSASSWKATSAHAATASATTSRAPITIRP